MADVVLVQPDMRQMPGGNIHFPMGVASLAAAAQQAGLRPAILDLQFHTKAPLAAVRAFLEEHRPRVIGVSGNTTRRFLSFDVMRIARAVTPKAVIVYGGCHATFADADTLAHLPELDLVVRGEGEATFVEIARRVLGSERPDLAIAGTSRRCDGAIVREPDRPRIEDLDGLTPAYNLFDLGRYVEPYTYIGYRTLPIMTSRGCPYHCAFCSVSPMWGERYTYRSAAAVADEMEMLIDRAGLDGVRVFDSHLALVRGRVEGLCAEFLRRSRRVRWGAALRADSVDRSLLHLMAEAGCQLVIMGLESADDGVRAQIGKRTTTAEVLRAARDAHAVGLRTRVFLMCGNPGETIDTARRSLAFRARYRWKIDSIPYMCAQVHPGTRLERLAWENGCLPAGWSWAAPDDRPANPALGAGRSDVIFTQPGFGWPEYRLIMDEYRRQVAQESRFSIASSWGRLKAFATSPHRARRLVRVLRRLIRQGAPRSGNAPPRVPRDTAED